jgi:hypothetical protein
LHRQHRTLSVFWHTHPLFAHSTSFTLAGFGVQSVILENDFRRFKNSPRSHGAYLGVSASSVAVAVDADFLCGIDAAADSFVARVFTAENVGESIGVEGLVLRFLDIEDVLSMSSVDVKSTLDVLFTFFWEESEVVDLLPIPLRRALNFRLVTFIAGRRLGY